MSRFCLAVTCAVVLLTAAGASAQTATVGGSVSNARGGVIAGADVTLRVLPPPGAPWRAYYHDFMEVNPL